MTTNRQARTSPAFKSPELHIRRAPAHKKTGRSYPLPVVLLYRITSYIFWMSGTISNATMLTTLIMGLMAGPAVSL